MMGEDQATVVEYPAIIEALRQRFAAERDQLVYELTVTQLALDRARSELLTLRQQTVADTQNTSGHTPTS